MIGKDTYIGQQIGNYEVIKKLGSGSFGTVYRAQNKFITTRIVAIKFMNTAYAGSQEERASFLREAGLLDKLKHAHILPILDFGIWEAADTYQSMPYMVTEYAANGSLRDRLIQESGHMLPLDESLHILSQVGQALQYAHQEHIVHRDLKPENILFNAQGEVLLADFGIATELPSSTIRNPNMISGTPAYMAPEQFGGTVSKLSDQYALGCIAYELLTGRRPFAGTDFADWTKKHGKDIPTSPRQLNPQLPEYTERAILKALAKERSERYPDITTFTTALQTSTPAPAPLPTPPFPMPSVGTATLQGPSGRTLLGPLHLTLGRAPDNEQIITDTQVSAHHALIRPEGTGYVIVDVGSTNGTFINEKKLDSNVPCRLKPGDVVRVGKTKYTYEVHGTASLPQVDFLEEKPVIAPPPPPPINTPVPARPPAPKPYVPKSPPVRPVVVRKRRGWRTFWGLVFWIAVVILIWYLVHSH